MELHTDAWHDRTMPNSIFPYWVYYWILGPLIGLMIGSFAGVVAVRLPRGQAWALGRSRCPSCEHDLGFADLVPLASWALIRGKCRYCGGAVSRFYPLVELAGAVVAVSAAFVFDGGLYWVSCGLGWVLVMLAATDWRHMVLPDGLTFPLLAAGLGVAYAIDPAKLAGHTLGAGIGYLLFAGTAVLYRRLRGREGLGLGDAKLMAAAGAWLGWAGLASVIIWGGLTALAWIVISSAVSGDKLSAARALPFGTFLAFGIWLVWLTGPLIIALPF